jgi:hypothetical protein
MRFWSVQRSSIGPHPGTGRQSHRRLVQRRGQASHRLGLVDIPTGARRLGTTKELLPEENTLVKVVKRSPDRWTPCSPTKRIPGEASGVQRSWSRQVWWAREELNLRPLPCQQNPGNRCATRRSPRSGRTVEAEGKRSPGVQLNALLHPLDPAVTACMAQPSSAQESLYGTVYPHLCINQAMP